MFNNRLINLSLIKSHLGLLLVLIAYFSITIYTSWHVPLSVGPDEVAHFMYARFLAQNGYLPLSPADREAAGYKSDQPPLNAAFVALLFWGETNQPPFVKLTHRVPRRHLVLDGLVDHTGRAFNIVDTEDPLAGDFLFWRFGRLMSTIFSGITLIIVYVTALKTFENFPKKNLWALATVTSVAFIPTFIFISGMFSYENLLGIWLSLYLLVVLYIIRNNEVNWLYLLAGVWMGLAIMTKLAALPIPLSFIVLVVMLGRRTHWSIKQYFIRLALGLLGVLLGAGWWFALIVAKLNKVAELGWIAGLLSPIFVGDGSGNDFTEPIVKILTSGTFENVKQIYWSKLPQWSEFMFKTFWTLKGDRQDKVISLLYIIAILILIGLIRGWRQLPKNHLWFAFLCVHIGSLFILPTVRLLIGGFESVAGQGQHVLFPAIGAFAILITWGSGAWFSSNRGWLSGIVLGISMFIWSMVHLWWGYPPSTPVPVRTVPPVMPTTANEFELEFDNFILAGYELKNLDEQGFCCTSTYASLGVNLYWVAKQFGTKDYLTQVSLVDSRGSIQSAWLGYPANGRYPNRAWEPGDIIRDEVYLPLKGLKPDEYTLQLQVWEVNGSLLTVDHKTDFSLTTVVLASASEEVLESSNPLKPQVWQDGRVVEQIPKFEYRSTIQITTDRGINLYLVGEDKTVYQPQLVVGAVHIFIVDSLWAKGAYRLQVMTNERTVHEIEPTLYVVGQARQTAIPHNQTVVKANFADQIMLLGYNLSKRHIAAGESLPLTLNWQALQTMPTDFIMFTRIRNQANEIWGGYDRWPREYYSPFMWVGGEVVEDSFTVEIDPNAPDGLYYLDVGFYLPMGDAAISLPIVQNGQMGNVTHITIGPFQVGDTLPAGVSTDPPTPTQPINQPFGNIPNLSLLGYDITGQTNQTKPELQITLYWLSESPLLIDYTTFVHLINSAGDLVAQQDRPPLGGQYPTSLWQPGEVITDKIVVPLPMTLPPDEYSLFIGLYDLNTGRRLEVPNHPEDRLLISKFTFD